MNKDLKKVTQAEYDALSDKSGFYYLASDTVNLYNENVKLNVKFWTPPKIGGRIFYDDGDNGATYTFYDADMQEITYTDIASLENAVYYTVSGTPTKDRFYVYDNTTHTTGGKTATDGLTEEIYWGYNNITTDVISDTIGSGKTNTAQILAIEDTSSCSDSIFKYIKACNDEKLSGCSDWYIGSKAEQYKLRASNLVTWYSNTWIWSAVEFTKYRAYYWDYSISSWDNSYKDYTSCCFAQRSF